MFNYRSVNRFLSHKIYTILVICDADDFRIPFLKIVQISDMRIYFACGYFLRKNFKKNSGNTPLIV